MKPEPLTVEHDLHLFCGAFGMHQAIGRFDQFQHMGIPCWKSPMLLDDPNEPDFPYAENE